MALANANFDMSLIRIEAPPEYKLLGSALAKSKRNVAEDGPAHVTARRLGSLFQSILPETPVWPHAILKPTVLPVRGVLANCYLAESDQSLWHASIGDRAVTCRQPQGDRCRRPFQRLRRS